MPALPLGCGRPEAGRRERKPLRMAVVRERSDPVPSEPEALCRLAKWGLEGVTPGSDHKQPRGEPGQGRSGEPWVQVIETVHGRQDPLRRRSLPPVPSQKPPWTCCHLRPRPYKPTRLWPSRGAGVWASAKSAVPGRRCCNEAARRLELAWTVPRPGVGRIRGWWSKSAAREARF